MKSSTARKDQSMLSIRSTNNINFPSNWKYFQNEIRLFLFSVLSVFS